MIKKLIIVLCCLLAITPVLAGQTASLTIQPSGIEIQNVQDLYGFDIKIVWNPNELTLKNATFNPIWPNYLVVIDKIDADFYRLVVVAISSSFNGSATLISLEFVGEGSISFSIVKLSDSLWQSIPVTLNSFHIANVLEQKALDAWKKQTYSI